MLKINSYTVKGTKLTPFVLPKDLEAKPNLSLLAQAIHIYEERKHIGLSSTKTRGEINRTKKKWYRQKGTGGARHGARSAPIFVGGGVSHGPLPLRRELTLPKAMKKKALQVALSLQVKEGKIIAVKGLSDIKKTSEVQKLVDKVIKEKSKRVTFVLPNDKKGTSKAFKNLKNSKAVLFRNLNAYDIFLGGTIILDKDIFEKKEK